MFWGDFMNFLFVIAMEKEANKIIEYYNLKKEENIYRKGNIELVITDFTRNGIVKSLIGIDTSDKIIINVGFVGSNNLDVGSVVQVDRSFGYHFDLTPFGDALYYAPNSPYELDKIDDLRSVDCYTSDGFVTSTNLIDDAIFDMELNILTVFPHKKLFSIKIVSDNLNTDEYEDFDYDVAIGSCIKYVDKIIKGF